MAEEKVIIRGWKEFWNDFIVKGLQENVSTGDIRNNVIEAMRKEVFGQLMFRTKVKDISEIQETDCNVAIVESLAKSYRQKFNALLKECRKYKETKDLFNENDLKLMFPQEEKEEEPEEDEWEDEDVEEIDEKTAEWPELSEEIREENIVVNEGDSTSSTN